jgi:hypothetical protein
MTDFSDSTASRPLWCIGHGFTIAQWQSFVTAVLDY